MLCVEISRSSRLLKDVSAFVSALYCLTYIPHYLSQHEMLGVARQCHKGQQIPVSDTMCRLTSLRPCYTAQSTPLLCQQNKALVCMYSVLIFTTCHKTTDSARWPLVVVPIFLTPSLCNNKTAYHRNDGANMSCTVHCNKMGNPNIIKDKTII